MKTLKVSTPYVGRVQDPRRGSRGRTKSRTERECVLYRGTETTRLLRDTPTTGENRIWEKFGESYRGKGPSEGDRRGVEQRDCVWTSTTVSHCCSDTCVPTDFLFVLSTEYVECRVTDRLGPCLNRDLLNKSNPTLLDLCSRFLYFDLWTIGPTVSP